MTNEEAKCKIRTLLEIGGSDGFDYREIEALEMAIRALSSWDRYSYELWKTAYARGYNDAKTLEQQPECEKEKEKPKINNHYMSRFMRVD